MCITKEAIPVKCFCTTSHYKIIRSHLRIGVKHAEAPFKWHALNHMSCALTMGRSFACNVCAYATYYSGILQRQRAQSRHGLWKHGRHFGTNPKTNTCEDQMMSQGKCAELYLVLCQNPTADGDDMRWLHMFAYPRKL